MKLLIKNDIEILDPNDDVIDYCINKLTIDNPDYLQALRMGRYLGNIEKKLKLYVKNGRVVALPFGCLEDVWKIKGNAEYILGFKPFKGNKMQGSINLYDYQENALNSLLKGKNGILEAPCGSGKTQIGLQLIKEIGGKALRLTHTKKLLEQSKARCEQYFKGDFGTITEGEVNIGSDITFATVQTMCKLDPSIYKDTFDIVIVDECHHCVGSPTKVMQFYKILSNCNCRYKYGLSATLTRADNLITTLFSIIGNKLYTIDKCDVGDKIIKAEYKVINVDLDIDPYSYIDTDGTLNYGKMINVLSNNEERNQVIIDNVKKNIERKQLILCHRVAQVEYLFKKISEFCSVNCVLGKINDKKRKYDASVIVATYQLAKEGLDIPELEILHLATPQKNTSVTEQSVGRIERNIEGKKTPICFDYVDINIPYCLGCYKKRKRILK